MHAQLSSVWPSPGEPVRKVPVAPVDARMRRPGSGPARVGPGAPRLGQTLDHHIVARRDSRTRRSDFSAPTIARAPGRPSLAHRSASLSSTRTAATRLAAASTALLFAFMSQSLGPLGAQRKGPKVEFQKIVRRPGARGRTLSWSSVWSRARLRPRSTTCARSSYLDLRSPERMALARLEPREFGPDDLELSDSAILEGTDLAPVSIIDTIS